MFVKYLRLFDKKPHEHKYSCSFSKAGSLNRRTEKKILGFDVFQFYNQVKYKTIIKNHNLFISYLLIKISLRLFSSLQFYDSVCLRFYDSVLNKM